VYESDRTLEAILLKPSMSQVHESVAKVGSSMKRNGARNSNGLEFAIPITERKASAVCDWSLWNERTKKVSSRFRHASDIQCDRFELDAARSWELS
jgi:hypothetical protein